MTLISPMEWRERHRLAQSVRVQGRRRAIFRTLGDETDVDDAIRTCSGLGVAPITGLHVKEWC